MKKKLEDIAVKDKTLISCDNRECDTYGDFYWCYKNQENQCGVYRSYGNENNKSKRKNKSFPR